MGEVTPFISLAEQEYQEYVRLVGVMNANLTFENARAAAKQWWRFVAAYDPRPGEGSPPHTKPERDKL